MRPSYLYHYSPISSNLSRRADNKIKQRLEEILLENKLYFAPPVGFNDPFDCHYIPELTEQCVKELMENKSLKRFPLVKRQKLLHQLNQDYQKHLQSTHNRESVSDKLREYIRANYGIVCLSELNNSIPMFAYYAGGHAGLCLEFVVKQSPNENFFNQAKKVIYTTEFPKLSFEHPSHKEIVDVILATKCQVWKHEREWRIIKTPGELSKDRKIPFPEQLLTGIVLGCTISEADKDFIINLLKQRKNRLSLRQARPAPGQYAIDVTSRVDY